MSAGSLFRKWVGAVGVGYEAGYIRATLGRRNSAGGLDMEVDGRPGYLHVTLSDAGSGGQTTDIAYNLLGVVQRELPVKLRAVGGRLVIKEADDGPALEAFLDGAPSGATHHHNWGSGLEYEHHSIWFQPGRVVWAGPAAPLSVAIRPFLHHYGGVSKYFAATTLDLTAYRPLAATFWAWVLVGVDPATNLAVAVRGAEYATQAELTDARIAAVNFGDNLPLAAIQVANGDAALSDFARYRDARHWLDLPGTGGGDADTLDGIDSLGFATAGHSHVPGDATTLDGFDSTDFALDIHTHPALYQPLDADLSEIAALVNVADQMLYSNATANWALATLTAAGRALNAGADASAQRTTLGLGTMALEVATAYLLLAGRAGGQTAYGGTASGNSLILYGTLHATPGPVVVNPNGGGLGVGIATPETVIHLQESTNGSVMKMQNSGSGTPAMVLHKENGSFGSPTKVLNGDIVGTLQWSGFNGTGDAVGGRIQCIATADWATGPGNAKTKFVFFTSGSQAAQQRLEITDDGKLGHGVESPTMFEFSHDGVSGRCFGTVNITDGTAQIIIPNGALDVKDVLMADILIDPSTGSSSNASPTLSTIPTTQTLFDSGGAQVLVLHLNADGSVDIQRTVGTFTYVVSVRMFWQ